MLSRYLAKKPDDKDALQLLAASAERRELYARALDAYDRILALDARQADALFAEARILLTAVQDPQKGLDMLARALGAGFDDAERIRALVEAPDLLDREAVEAALKDKGLLPEAGAAAAPAGQ
jgi:tetratricopeptide (TPR) repeat protein